MITNSNPSYVFKRSPKLTTIANENINISNINLRSNSASVININNRQESKSVIVANINKIPKIKKAEKTKEDNKDDLIKEIF